MCEKVRRFRFTASTHIEWCESDFDKNPVEGLKALTQDDAWNVLRDLRMKDIEWKLVTDTGVIDDKEVLDEKASVPCDAVYNAIKRLTEKGVDTKELEDVFCDFECAWREHAHEFHGGDPYYDLQ